MAACGNCGRYFNEDRVQKHESICTKQKKRKVFDATKHRVQGTEAEVYVKKALKSTPKKQVAAEVSPEKKSNWRKKHEEFIAAIRSAKQVQAHLAAGGKLSDVRLSRIIFMFVNLTLNFCFKKNSYHRHLHLKILITFSVHTVHEDLINLLLTVTYRNVPTFNLTNLNQ